MSDGVKDTSWPWCNSIQSDLCWDVEGGGIVGKNMDEYMGEVRYKPECSGEGE